MSRPGLLFLICPDAELINARIATVMQGQAGAERKAFWGDDDPPLPGSFWQDLQVKGLFSNPKALIVRRAHLLKAEHWDKLDAAMKSRSSDVTLFLCLEGEWKNGKPSVPSVLTKRALWKDADKNGLVWQEQGLTPGNMGKFIQAWAGRESLTLAPGALQALTQALPPEARAARLELDKLALASTDGQVTAQHAQLIAPHQEMDFFQFTDALSKGGDLLSVWKRVLQDHLKQSKDQMLFPLLGSVAREARMLMMLAAGEDTKIKAHPYVKKLKTPIAKRLGPAKIARIFDLLLEAELGVKTGEHRTDQALDILVSKLSLLYRS
ncbi:MAG: DNA polymerase III subunit delta [Proteobacteria bacterium]|nr:DNA polymerase III subunit delta [Pseudomonadota bacterium]